jgi:hypothetical protein
VSSTLDQKLLLDDFVLKKPSLGQKVVKSIHFGSAESKTYIENSKSDGISGKKLEVDDPPTLLLLAIASLRDPVINGVPHPI